MRWLITLLILLVWQAYPVVAHACTCGLAAGYPADGETEVPTDAELALPSADKLPPCCAGLMARRCQPACEVRQASRWREGAMAWLPVPLARCGRVQLELAGLEAGGTR